MAVPAPLRLWRNTTSIPRHSWPASTSPPRVSTGAPCRADRAPFAGLLPAVGGVLSVFICHVFFGLYAPRRNFIALGIVIGASCQRKRGGLLGRRRRLAGLRLAAHPKHRGLRAAPESKKAGAPWRPLFGRGPVLNVLDGSPPWRRILTSRDAKTMPENYPAACRRSAERCRRRAEAAKDEIGKAAWHTFAEEWLKLADEAEQSVGRR